MYTEEVRELVAEVLACLPEPYGPDITDDVCWAIQNNRIWYGEYLILCEELGKSVVNNSIGRNVCEHAGKSEMAREHRVRARANKIIGVYTRFVEG